MALQDKFLHEDQQFVSVMELVQRIEADQFVNQDVAATIVFRFLARAFDHPGWEGTFPLKLFFYDKVIGLTAARVRDDELMLYRLRLWIEACQGRSEHSSDAIANGVEDDPPF